MTQQRYPNADGDANQAGLPRLQLPTFTLRQSTPTPLQASAPTPMSAPQVMPAAPQAYQAPAPQAAAPAHQPPPGLHPAHLVYAQPQPPAPQGYAPTGYPQQQVHVQQAAPAARPAPRPAPAQSQLRPAFATATYAPVPAEGLWGGRVTPMQLGMLLTAIAAVFVIAKGGPAPMDTSLPSALPAASNTAAAPATAATLPLRREPQGIPSTAASAALQAQKNGTAAGATMAGMPSPAAAEKLKGTQTLPLRKDDGYALPAGSGDRDSHGNEQHYESTLPMERPVERPALTPAEAEQQAQLRNIDATVEGTHGAMPSLATGGSF